MKIYLVTIIFMVVDLFLLNFWLVSPAKYLEPYFDQDVIAVGYIEPLTFKVNEKGKSFILSCEQLQISGKSHRYNHKLRVYTDLTNKNSGKIRARGRLSELRNFANPGSFNMEAYNWVQGIGGAITKAKVESIGNRRFVDELALLNLTLRAFVEKGTTTKVAGVLSGMVLGGNQIEDNIREAFSNNGLSHLLSVSGTHLMLLASFFQGILKYVSCLTKRKRDILIILILYVYAGICGFKPPVLRALAMTSVLCWGNDSRNVERGKILCVISLVMLIYKPIWLLDLGFQLSFGATAGLIWLMPKIKERLDELLPEFLSSGIAVTCAAQLATLPILVVNFYTVPIIAVLSNLLLVPVLELTTIFTLLGMLLSLGWPYLGNLIFKIAAWLMEQVIFQAELLAKAPFSNIVVGILPVFCIVIYYIAVFSWLDLGPMLLLSKRERKLCIFCSSFIIMGSYLWGRCSPMSTSVYFMDVGQGDGAVVVSPQRKVAVIDTGGLKGLDTGTRIITPFIHSLGINKVDVFIPSHSDFDHIGGAKGLARNIAIEKIILPREILKDGSLQLMKDFLKYVEPNKIENARQGQVYDLGGARLKLVSVPKSSLSGNDASTVVELEDISTSRKVLFTGDMTVKREAKLESINKYDVLKVGHHGSKGSTSEYFLGLIKPKLAIISCGYRNMYGHPHASTLARLENAGSIVLRTDEDGCIRVEFRKDGIGCTKWRS